MISMNGSLINFDSLLDGPDIREKAMANVEDGGPNSGFEIQDIEFFKNPKLTNQFPEMKDDIDLIISTESYIKRLVDFDQRLRDTGGMSRGMSYELKELIPSMESFSPNHYTEMVSGVGWEPSCEAISIRIWAVIASAAALLMSLIYKFLKWIFGDSRQGSSSSSDFSEIRKGIGETDKKNKSQTKIIQHAAGLLKKHSNEEISVQLPKGVNHAEIDRSHLPKVLKEEIKKKTLDEQVGEHITFPPPGERPVHNLLKFRLKDVLKDMEGGDAIFDYMVRPNQYARVLYSPKNDAIPFIIDSFDIFKDVSKIVLGQLDVLSTIISDLEKVEDVNDATRNRIRDSLETLDSMKIDEKILRVRGETFPTTGVWAIALRDRIVQGAMEEPFFVDFEELIQGYVDGKERLKNVEFGKILVFIDTLERAQPIIERMSKWASRQKERVAGGKIDPEAQAFANEVIRTYRTVSQNLVGLMRSYHEISNVFYEVSKHGYDILKTLKRHSGALINVHRRFGEMYPPSLEDLYDAVRDDLKEFSDNLIMPNMLPQGIKAVSIDEIATTRGGFVAPGTPVDQPLSEKESFDLSFTQTMSIKELLQDAAREQNKEDD